MKYILLLFTALFYSSVLIAGSATNAQELNFFRTGHQTNVLVVVGGASGFTSNEGCSSSRAAIDPSTNNAKEMYSHLLSAYMAGKKVMFYGNGCVSADSTEYIKIEYVYFNQQ